MNSVNSLTDKFRDLGQEGKYAEILEKLRLATGINQLFATYWNLHCYQNMGLVEEGLNYYKTYQKYLENEDELQLKAKILNIVGDLYYKNGQSLTAYEFFQKALDAAMRLGQMDQVSIALNNLGVVNVARGNLDKGLEYYEKCLNQAIKSNDRLLHSNTLYNLGNIHFLNKDYTLAENMFKEALQLRRDIGNQTKIALTLSSLLELEFETEPDLDQVNAYLDEIKNIANSTNTSSTMLYYLFCKAIKYKWEGELQKAEMIFRRIIDDNKDIDITVSSILHFIEILFLNYQEDQDDNTLEDIHTFLDKMFRISKSQYSFRYLVKSLILKSQLTAIEGDFEQSFHLIEQALNATEDQKMDYLRNEVIRLKEELTGEYKKLEELFEDESSVLSRIKKSSIMELLRE